MNEERIIQNMDWNPKGLFSYMNKATNKKSEIGPGVGEVYENEQKKSLQDVKWQSNIGQLAWQCNGIKIFERVVKGHTETYDQQKSYEGQHRFVPGKSMQTQLLAHYNLCGTVIQGKRIDTFSRLC